MPTPLNYQDPAKPTALPLDSLGTTQIEDYGLEVNRSVLPGGVRLITQNVPGSLSTALGMWVAVGSRDEGPGEGGISHFLEHLLFKGTPTRSAFEIAEAFDSVGAESNAATMKESTFYWAHMVARDLPALLPVLVDMVTDSSITPTDVEVERGVILDELAMSEDSPDEAASEAFARAVYGDSGLGRPIGGTSRSVAALEADTIRSLYRSRYSTSDLIVCASGEVDHDALAAQVMSSLGSSSWAEQLREDVLPTRRANSPADLGLGHHEREIWIRRDIEQSHLVLGGPWLPALDPAVPASSVTMNLLGGGMSSRLFQEIREKRGLAYTTYAFTSAYAGAGHFGLYAGCAPSKLTEVEKVMWGEVEKLATQGPSEAELRRIKGQVRGSMTLRLEDMTTRMSRLAGAELTGQFVSVTDAVERIDAVQGEDVKEMAARMLTADRSKAVVTTND